MEIRKTNPNDLPFHQFDIYCQAFVGAAWTDLCMVNVCEKELKIVKGDADSEILIMKVHPYITININMDDMDGWDDLIRTLCHELGHCVTFQYRQFQIIHAHEQEDEHCLIHEQFAMRFANTCMSCGLAEKWDKVAYDLIIRESKDAKKANQSS